MAGSTQTAGANFTIKRISDFKGQEATAVADKSMGGVTDSAGGLKIQFYEKEVNAEEAKAKAGGNEGLANLLTD